MKKLMPPGKQDHVTMIRMSGKLKEQIRKYQMQMQEETGLQVGFATAAKRLIEQALVATGIK